MNKRNNELTYKNYADVPWHRRSAINSTLLLVQLLTLLYFPTALWVSLVLLTGDIFYDKKDPEGNLKKWGPGNKIAALAMVVIFIILVFHSPFKNAK